MGRGTIRSSGGYYTPNQIGKGGVEEGNSAPPTDESVFARTWRAVFESLYERWGRRQNILLT